MTKQFFIDIRNRLLSNTQLKFVQLWNNQMEDLAGKENNSYSFPLPAVFVEFVAPSEVLQMGDGAQIFDPLIVRLHIIHEFLNNIDDTNGMLEQDLAILDLKQWVYFNFQHYTPNNAVAFVRVAETIDYNHNNVVEFIQDYKTNLIDASHSDEAIGTINVPPAILQLTITQEPSI